MDPDTENILTRIQLVFRAVTNTFMSFRQDGPRASQHQNRQAKARGKRGKREFRLDDYDYPSVSKCTCNDMTTRPSANLTLLHQASRWKMTVRLKGGVLV